MKTKKSAQAAKGGRAKDAFWRVVEDCLVEFHKIASPDARTRTNDLRSRVDQAPPGVSRATIYHAEPFDVACDIAANALDPAQYRNTYDAILKRHNW